MAKKRKKKISGKVNFDFKSLTRGQKDNVKEAMKNKNWSNF